MALDIRPWSWWTTLRGMAFIFPMHCWPRIWIIILVDLSQHSEMDGTLMHWTTRSHSKWIFPPITWNIQTNQRGWSKFSPNVDFCDPDCWCSARSQPVIPMQPVAVQNASLICNPISRNKSPLSMKQLRLLVTSALCYQNITVNSTSLSSFREQWRGTSVSTVIIHFQDSNKIFQMPCIQLMCLPFGSGSIIWSVGWMLTEKGRALRRLRYR